MLNGEEMALVDLKNEFEEELKKKENDDIETLKHLLRQLFQLQVDDQLNYGIFRIMNEKRSEVEKFINKTLPDRVRGTIQKDLTQENARIHRSFIISHIHSFFSRYYEKGDFMPLRRYSTHQKYSIPYNGEEVLLHWTNKNQYYIKTGEHFSNSAFRVGKYTIRFRTILAETVQDNIKGSDRFFILTGGDSPFNWDLEKSELIISLEYRSLLESEKKFYQKETKGNPKKTDDDKNQNKGTIKNHQKHINEKIIPEIFKFISDNNIGQLESLKPEISQHFNIYTEKHTTDYFIHKDLGGFLSRELDYYIKNEVLHLDGLESGAKVDIEVYINRAKIIKKIGEEIIAFLAQIEEFQKRLFEKKKFVIGCNYCLTIDRVPRDFWQDIIKNKAQIAEWEKLYGFGSSLQQSLFSGYDISFLEAHPFLMIDTKFFDEKFTDHLLGSFEDLDAATGGLMIKSENFQALNLLQERYKESIKCIYIDPPYNTGNDGFIYKDRYQHSSWLSMMYERVLSSFTLLLESGSFFSSIDDNEIDNYLGLLNTIYSPENKISNIVWEKMYTVKNDSQNISNSHEYILSYCKNNLFLSFNLLPRTKEMDDRYKNPDNDERGPWKPIPLHAAEERKNGRYPIISPTGVVHTLPPNTHWRVTEEDMSKLLEEGRIWFGKDGSSQPNLKRFLSEVQQGKKARTIWTHKEVGSNDSAKREIKQIFGKGKVPYDFPKPTTLLKNIFLLSITGKDTVIDYFAGSGTTAHAVLSLNKEDSGTRKYILVEMANHFDAVMKPRIQKVCYSLNWDDGLPNGTDGLSHMFKYFSLESYEDSLNNITFDNSVQKTFMNLEGYFLNYLLDFETRNSPCRLTVENLKHPFEYQLKVIRDNSEQVVMVDLPETFAYLIGLQVQLRKVYTNGPTPRYLIYHGSNQSGAVTVIWRDCDGLNLEDDKKYVVDMILKETPRSDTLYMNGDFIVPGAQGLERIFKEQMGA